MLVKKVSENRKAPTIWYDAIGNQFNEYVVDIKEDEKSREVINLDDALKDDDWKDFEDCFEDYCWDDTPAAEEEEKIYTKKEFLDMDYKECQYHIYKQLVDISSSLSYIKDVAKYGDKSK